MDFPDGATKELVSPTEAPPPGRGGPLDPATIRTRIFRAACDRADVSGRVAFRAIPSAAPAYAARLLQIFEAHGKAFRYEEAERLRGAIEDTLNEVSALEPESRLICDYSTRADHDVVYRLTVERRALAARYAPPRTDGVPHFGRHPDARLTSLVGELGHPREVSILDIGAGTGRNAIALRRNGHPVVAVEAVSAFVEELLKDAQEASIDVPTIVGDFLDASVAVRCGEGHAVAVASEMVPHLPTDAELRTFFSHAHGSLRDGGYLLINGFLPDAGYVPDSVAREASALAWSTFFTRTEYEEAAAGFELLELTDAVTYERERWPASDWPPTKWFEGWANAGDVFGAPGPARLHWLLFRKRHDAQT
jgi:SAM-dependent methyltransferase